MEGSGSELGYKGNGSGWLREGSELIKGLGCRSGSKSTHDEGWVVTIEWWRSGDCGTSSSDDDEGGEVTGLPTDRYRQLGFVTDCDA